MAWKMLCNNVLRDKLAPQQKKYSRRNNMPFINTTKKSPYDEKPFEKHISQKPFR